MLDTQSAQTVRKVIGQTVIISPAYKHYRCFGKDFPISMWVRGAVRCIIIWRTRRIAYLAEGEFIRSRILGNHTTGLATFLSFFYVTIIVSSFSFYGLNGEGGATPSLVAFASSSEYFPSLTQRDIFPTVCSCSEWYWSLVPEPVTGSHICVELHKYIS